MMRRTTLALLAFTLAMGCDSETRGGDGGRTDDGGRDSGAQDSGGQDAGQDAGTCVDGDGDGYGEGCALGPDCDDTSAAVSPGATETCNGVDDDCDDATDEDLVAPSCALVLGVCTGATARCGGAGGFLECDATDYGADYEADESACDTLDNDCDGSTDEGCECTEGATQPCGSDVGLCVPGTQTCTGGSFGACEGETGPMGEACDGADNDCDGATDEPADLTAPSCPLQLGVCSGSTRACGGVAGWIACSGIASYGGDYQTSETICDGLDNDCDGVTDEGCACIDGATQACGTDVGACMAGVQTCTAGAWGACAGEITPVSETCNGVDDDCDGTPDDSLTGPPCALSAGVCAGSTQACGGASGFAACTAARYGANYEATESRCDGLDNDCDGMTDEGCTCTDGATQACGSAVGVCMRGTQTCAGGVWGTCTGGVEASAETCNGLDDDCNGSSDDGLAPRACALTLGVCAGTTQTCRGALGYEACAGTASYGARYVTTENGATDESVCDGLDNDCDGMTDEGCTSGPIVAATEDEVLPDLFHRHLVYLVNYDGNWDVTFASLETGEVRRLTTTAANEGQPRVYGNHVVYTRGADAAQRVVLYNLVTGVETVLTTRQSGSPDISGGTIVYDEWDGAQWDIYLYDIATATAQSLFVGGTPDNELQPSLRGNRLAFVGDASGRFLTYLATFGATPTLEVQTPASSSAAGQILPIADYLAIGWSDGRFISSSPATATDDWDIFGGPYSGTGAFPGETAVTLAEGAQLLRGIDGQVFAWSDYRNGNWDVAIGTLDGTQALLSTHPSTQADPTISGNLVFWEDNRLGSYDIYGTQFGGAPVPTVMGLLVINEILADPAPTADVNGDGVASTTQDEFVEIVNATGVALDISGFTLSDASSVRHTFPAGTVIPALGSIVVFGGGSLGSTSLFGGARVQFASSGTLALNNDGDTLTLRNGATVIDTVTYGSTIAAGDQSIVRDPEIGGTTFVRHTLAAGAVGAQSPGLGVRGFAF